MIQQLQDEIERLTKKFSGSSNCFNFISRATYIIILIDARPTFTDIHGTTNQDGINVAEVLLKQENEQLKRRLEQANNRIQTLIRDKERLLEISNNLRSQLNRYEGKYSNKWNYCVTYF